MNNEENPTQVDPMVNLILELAQKKQRGVLRQIRSLIYQPLRTRYHPILFSTLPGKEMGVSYYALRQTYRLIGPMMAGYPQTTDTGNFGRSLGELEAMIGGAVVERKALILRQSLKLHWAESTLLRLVTLMQDNHVLINWNQLVTDTRYWNVKVLNSWFEQLISVRNRKEKVR